MKRTARTRSAFGQFQMGTSHIKTNIDKVVPRPRATDMAEMLREGKTLEQVAEVMDLAVGTVRSRLNQSGFSSSGQVKGKK